MKPNMTRRDEDWIKGENITLYFVLNTSENVTDEQRKKLKKAIKKLRKNINEIELEIETARSEITEDVYKKDQE